MRQHILVCGPYLRPETRRKKLSKFGGQMGLYAVAFSHMRSAYAPQPLALAEGVTPWYADFANYLACDLLPEDLTFHQRKTFLHDVKSYFWDDPYIFKVCANNIIRPVCKRLNHLEDLKAI